MIGLLLAASTWGWGTDKFDGWPPTRFMGDNTASIKFVKPSEIDRACGTKPNPNYPLEACEDDDQIVLPNPCAFPRSDDFARLACHELAHRNHWSGNHPK